MWIPSHKGFLAQFASRAPAGYFFSQGMHPNPRFYKYIWRVWTPDRQMEGEAFFRDAPALSTAQFMELKALLDEKRVHYFVYNSGRPRLDGPFDPTSPKLAGVKFAPSLADDSDPEWQGHR